MSDRDEALRLAREAGFLSNAYLRNNQPYIHDADGIDITDELERFYQLCHYQFAGRGSEPAKVRYDSAMEGCEPATPLENLRFFLSIALKNPQDWIDVEPFLDALPTIHAPPSESAPIEGATPILPDLESEDYYFLPSAEPFFDADQMLNCAKDFALISALAAERKNLRDFVATLHTRAPTDADDDLMYAEFIDEYIAALGNTDGGSNE